MSNSQWSALVYGRTYEVDFRLIAMPEGFEDEDKKWALKYILGTTRSPEKLPKQPCWSLFKNDKYCVVGVTCMARELIGDCSNDNAEDFTRDKSTSGGLGRPLYGFFGYVAKLDGQNLPPIPKYLDTNLEAFKPLYNYIKQCWCVKNYESASREAILSKYEELEFDSAKSDSSSLTNLKFNSSEGNITLCFHSPENANNLWLSASQSSAPISLCLGISREKDAINSPFLNATVLNLKQESYTIEKPKHQQHPSPNDDLSGEPNHKTRTQSSSQSLTEDPNSEESKEYASCPLSSNELLHNLTQFLGSPLERLQEFVQNLEPLRQFLTNLMPNKDDTKISSSEQDTQEEQLEFKDKSPESPKENQGDWF